MLALPVAVTPVIPPVDTASIDVISNDWKEFELVQSKMFDMGFHLSEVEEWDEEDDLKIISRFSPEEQIFN